MEEKWAVWREKSPVLVEAVMYHMHTKPPKNSGGARIRRDHGAPVYLYEVLHSAHVANLGLYVSCRPGAKGFIPNGVIVIFRK
jgi:hypothetical protein